MTSGPDGRLPRGWRKDWLQVVQEALPATPRDDWTIAQAREQFAMDMGHAKGTHCPCCGSYNAIQYRNLGHYAAAQLANLVDSWHRAGGAREEVWLTAKQAMSERLRTRYPGSWFGKLALFALVRQKDRDYWQPTDEGLDFLAGRICIPRNAILINNVMSERRLLGFSGPATWYQDLLGEAFDYGTLMRAMGDAWIRQSDGERSDPFFMPPSDLKPQTHPSPSPTQPVYSIDWDSLEQEDLFQ